MNCISDLNFREDLIILNENELNNILSLINPKYISNNILIKTFNKSCFDKNIIIRLIHKWLDRMISFDDKYNERNNDWFFVLMNELSITEQNIFIDQFIGDKKVVNKLNDIHTRNTEMTINHFKNNKYSINDIHKLLSDMRCFVAIDNGDYNDEPETIHVKYISTRPTQECYIRNYKTGTDKFRQFENEFEKIYPIENNSTICLLDVLNKWKHYFVYN